MIYVKTELGQSALLNRSVALMPRQRSAFIMFDGKRSVDDVLKATAGLGIAEDDVNHMVKLGLLQVVPSELLSSIASAAASAAVTGPVQDTPDKFSLDAQAHYSKAYPIATRLTADLGLRGFRLNLAVEAAGDLLKLQELAPKIKEAVGSEKYLELNSALFD